VLNSAKRLDLQFTLVDPVKHSSVYDRSSWFGAAMDDKDGATMLSLSIKSALAALAARVERVCAKHERELTRDTRGCSPAPSRRNCLRRLRMALEPGVHPLAQP
jgi:hypothetical protein